MREIVLSASPDSSELLEESVRGKQFRFQPAIWGNSVMRTTDMYLNLDPNGGYEFSFVADVLARMANFRHMIRFASAEIGGYLFDITLPNVQYPRGSHQVAQLGNSPFIRYDYERINFITVTGDGIFDTGG